MDFIEDQKSKDQTAPACESFIPFLEASDFCEVNSPIISHMSKSIMKSCLSDEERTIRSFYWVRDQITYYLGLRAHTSTETMAFRQGSCSNKANLLVALLRNAGIPAAFRFYRVRTNEYFGPLCPQRLSKFMSLESYHIFVSVYLSGKWLRIDPTDDGLLSEGAQHLCQQARKIHFDGTSEALLHLDPGHIVIECHDNLRNIDFILKKEGRQPLDVLWAMNAYLDFLRSFGSYYNSIEEVGESFFSWVQMTHPENYERFKVKELELVEKFPESGIKEQQATNLVEANA